MPRKKVRYRVGVKGEYREVFSVGEGSTGDLAISFRGADQMTVPGGQGEMARLLEDRFSVHHSPLSTLSGTTITRTTSFENNTSVKFATFVKHSRKHLLWHLFSTTLPELSPLRYDPNNQGTSRIVKLRENVPPTSTLCCHIFVANKGRPCAPSPVNMISAVDFKKFRVITYTNYLNLPVFRLASSSAIQTTTRMIDGVKQQDRLDFYQERFPGGAISLNDEDVPRLIYYNNQRMYLSLALQMIIDVTKSAPTLADEVRNVLKDHKPFFSIFPIEESKRLFVLNQRPDPWNPPKQE